MYRSNEDQWIDDAKLALSWFIDVIGEDVWTERRSQVVGYFNDLVEQQFSIDGVKPLSPSQPFRPVAIYDDWIAWYMYLVECLRDRPTCDEPMQSARIFPFFSAIGRNIVRLKDSNGIDERLQNLLSKKQNQPDSTLYELVVASAYIRNGWSIEFIPEAPPLKTPDFIARKPELEVFVECKRFAKTSGYAENERQAWIIRWNPLCALLQDTGQSIHVDVLFKKPIASLPPDYLLNLYMESYSPEKLNMQAIVETDEVVFSARHINMKTVHNHLENYYVRNGSPQLIQLLSGKYEPLSNYAQAISLSDCYLMGPDDGLHACNVFISGINSAISAKWECVASESINAKAKDVTKLLSKAIAQAPDNGTTCIHIGYETLNGSEIEIVRHAKIAETVRNFDYLGKDIHTIFFNAMQPISKIDFFECAETTTYFSVGGKDPRNILNEMLLLDKPGTTYEKSTHWGQDIEAGT